MSGDIEPRFDNLSADADQTWMGILDPAGFACAASLFERLKRFFPFPAIIWLKARREQDFWCSACFEFLKDMLGRLHSIANDEGQRPGRMTCDGIGCDLLDERLGFLPLLGLKLGD